MLIDLHRIIHCILTTWVYCAKSLHFNAPLLLLLINSALNPPLMLSLMHSCCTHTSPSFMRYRSLSNTAVSSCDLPCCSTETKYSQEVLPPIYLITVLFPMSYILVAYIGEEKPSHPCSTQHSRICIPPLFYPLMLTL